MSERLARTKPRLLDLFCGGGGASAGYVRAGFDVVGVDIEPQAGYPYEFIQADALTFPLEGYDAVHASPVCKAHTKTGWAYYFNYHDRHADMLTPTRARLVEWGGPWVIENVPGAPMRVDVQLCGSQFGLGVRRHRWFELSWPLFEFMPPCDHTLRVVSPHGNPNRFKGTGKQWGEAMRIDWMTTPQLAQAIPPAYTEWVGARLLDQIEMAA